jgi:hypothetical protein
VSRAKPAKQTGARRVGAAQVRSKGAPLNTDSEAGFATSIQGQILRRSERREVAIFLRDGALWIADFIDGKGTLVDAATWFRFNCGALASSHAGRRMVLESAIPLSPDLVARIRLLPPPPAMRKPGAVALLLERIAFLPRGGAAATLARFLRRSERIDAPRTRADWRTSDRL